MKKLIFHLVCPFSETVLFNSNVKVCLKFISLNQKCVFDFKQLRMDEYIVFETDDLGFIIQEIYENVMFSYSSGCYDVKVRVRSLTAIFYLHKWMPGWVRKAGPGGIWKNSKGECFSDSCCGLI